MANTTSAQKAHRQSGRRRAVNTMRMSALKTSIKKLRVALEQPSRSMEAKAQLDTMLRSVAAQLARAKSKKTMKRNTASRVLSKLARQVASVNAN